MGERKFDIDGEAQSLTSSFGITDTQTIESDELSNFLSDNSSTAIADPKDVTAIEEEVETPEVKTEPKKKTKKDPTPKEVESSLKDFLVEETEEDDQPSVEGGPDTKKSKESDNIFVQLSKDLYDLNIFTPTEGEAPIKTAEDFLNKFNKEKETQAFTHLEDFLSQFGDDYKEAFDAIYINGVSPKEYFTTAARIQSVKDLDLKEKKNQEKVFTEYWRRQGLSEEKIAKRLEKAVDFDTLEEDATEFHEALVSHETQELERMKVERAQAEAHKKAADQAYAQSLKETLSKKVQEKEFDGIPLTDKDAKEIFDYMYTKKWKLPNGDLLTDQEKDYLELKDPRNLELRIKHALLQKRKYDLSTIAKTAVSKKADSIFQNLVKEEKQAKAQFKHTTGKSFF